MFDLLLALNPPVVHEQVIVTPAPALAQGVLFPPVAGDNWVLPRQGRALPQGDPHGQSITIPSGASVYVRSTGRVSRGSGPQGEFSVIDATVTYNGRIYWLSVVIPD